MQIRVGYELVYQFPQPTPMILTLDVHFTRASDILSLEHLTTSPAVPVSAYRDSFGNWCSRLVAPAGRIQITNGATVKDSGLIDPVVPDAWQHSIETLPEDT